VCFQYLNHRGAAMIREVPPPSPPAIFFLVAVWLECRTWQVTVTVYGRGRLGRKSERCRYPLGLNYARESLLTDCQTLGTPPGRNLRSLNRLEAGKLAPSYRIKSTNMQPSPALAELLINTWHLSRRKGKKQIPARRLMDRRPSQKSILLSFSFSLCK
jgi:hypothetical protein